MKKYICIALTILLLLIGFSSCNDEAFLEEKPATFYTIDNVFSTSEQVDQVLVSIYSEIRNLWTNPQEKKWIFDFRGKGTDMYDIPSIRKSNTFSDYSLINPDHNSFYQVYSIWYDIISRANLAIYAANLPKISWSSESEKAYAIAQAHFFRAFAYKNLGELYGGVPIVTEITTTPRYDFERASHIETYQFAINDLESIIDDLPETSKSGGRIVKGAGLHTLSELYLAMGTLMDEEGNSSEAQQAFNKAISSANQVIDSGVFSLVNSRYGSRKDENSVTINVYKEGSVSLGIIDTILITTNYYWDLFQEGNVNYQDGNTECIWALQIDYEAYQAEDNFSTLKYARTFGAVFRRGAKNHTLGVLENVGGRGVAQVIPTMYTRDTIYQGKWADDMRNTDIVFRRRFKGNVESSPYYQKDIPLEYIYNQTTDESTNMQNRSVCYPISCKISVDKFTREDDPNYRSNLYRDEYVIRLSETVLLRAEAKQRLGDKDGAAEDINILRNRAQCKYLVNATDMDDNFNLILDERARELVYEECRWNTLLRMGGTIASDRIRKHAYWPETAATLTFDYNLWPIPQTVIDSNSEIKLEQNPGWSN